MVIFRVCLMREWALGLGFRWSREAFGILPLTVRLRTETEAREFTLRERLVRYPESVRSETFVSSRVSKKMCWLADWKGLALERSANPPGR